MQLSAEILQQPLSTLVEENSDQDETDNSPLWSMYFDGSCTRKNAGAGVWINNTESKHTEGISCKLNFQCSNNIAEYESLLLGLHLLKKLGAKRIIVFGDSELIIRQVNGEYNTNHPRLRAYCNDVMDLLKKFKESKLIFVPRKRNIAAHNLSFAARTCLTPYETKDCTTEIKFRPVVPDNENYWQVFDNDKQIEDFMQFRNEFELHSSNSDYDTNCSEENFLGEEEPSPEPVNINLWSRKLKNKTELDAELETDESKTLHSKDESLPSSLAPLEELFDLNDVAKKPKLEPIEAEVEECNIGSELKPMMIKLSKNLSAHIKLKYIELFKYFSDVFAWSYEDLKSYDTEIIQHKIPLKENQKPFKQKLRRINLVQLPLVQKEIMKMYEAGIIVPIRYSEWVSNLVLVTKKTGEIRLCIDFRDLNKASLKDNYPLPKMDHIL